MTLSDGSQTQWRQTCVSLGAMRTNKHYSDWQLALLFFSLKDVKEQQGHCGIQIYVWDQTEENILLHFSFYIKMKSNVDRWEVKGYEWRCLRWNLILKIQYVSIYQRFIMKHNVKVVRWHWNTALNTEENHCWRKHCQMSYSLHNPKVLTYRRRGVKKLKAKISEFGFLNS